MVKVSVIIPCYNQEKYIAECIDSVLAQTFTDYEMIVIDDGSTDNSVSIIEEYAKKHKNIKFIKQKNQGVIAARNNAIKLAEGKLADLAPTMLDIMGLAKPEEMTGNSLLIK